ncbi:MAG: peptide chain release factor N(5)-glutamine methyltransferase [Stenotrophobium sp.]
MNVADALTQAVRTLGVSSESPQADAEFLLAHVLEISRGALYGRMQRPLPVEADEQLQFLLARRSQGEPVAYLTGDQGFWSLDLAVTPEVLIPRPETELLVEWALDVLDGMPLKAPACIADLGTGSGAIALALATELPQAAVTAMDVSAAALSVARRNAEKLRINNVQFEQSDFDAFLTACGCGGKTAFDVLISNPPYVATGDPHLAALRHEPELALIAGADGLDCLRMICTRAPQALQQGGWLLLEHGCDQGPAVRELMRAAGFTNVQTRRDLATQERATGGMKP